jgi:hypothetical protein
MEANSCFDRTRITDQTNAISGIGRATVVKHNSKMGQKAQYTCDFVQAHIQSIRGVARGLLGDRLGLRQMRFNLGFNTSYCQKKKGSIPLRLGCLRVLLALTAALALGAWRAMATAADGSSCVVRIPHGTSSYRGRVMVEVTLT